MASFNTNAKNDILDGFDSMFNAGALEIRTGSSPGAGSAATGTLLVSITLPADAFAAASGGSKAKAGTWAANAVAAGTAGYVRMKSSDGSRVIDLTCTATGGGGECELDNTSIANGQPVTVTACTINV